MDSSLYVNINYQYDAVSMLKSELIPHSRSKYNTLSFTVDNENEYHINNVQVLIIFNFFIKPLENFTTISPANYDISSIDQKINSVNFSFFEIRSKASWEIDIRFNEIIHGCMDSKNFEFNSQKDANYLTGTWVIIMIFLFLLMLILYCGEITNLKNKIK